MSLDTTIPHSRRTLLAGAIATGAAMLASALGRTAVVHAADGDPVLLGTPNTSASTTQVAQPSGSGPVFRAASEWGTAVQAHQGSLVAIPTPPQPGGALYAYCGGASGSYAVRGESSNGYGVYGFSHMASGITGYSDAPSYAATEGRGTIGVAGFAGSGGVPAPAQGTGVYGSGATAGTWGASTGGPGAFGASQTGPGVRGSNSTATYGAVEGLGPVGVAGWGSVPHEGLGSRAGTGVFGSGTVAGVRGESATGIGVHAVSAKGTALKVTGKAAFDRAGTVTMRAGTSTYKKTLAGVTTSSQVFAVLRTRRSGTYVAAVSCSSGYFTIRLNKALAYKTTVSWFVVN
jgi:hypothetical protein